MATAMVCERCGIDYPDGRKFCGRCGEVLTPKAGAPPRRPCPLCGTATEDDDRFCPTCGGALDGDATTPPAPPRVERGPERRCPSCGTVVSMDDAICDLCGASLAAAAPKPPSATTFPPPARSAPARPVGPSDEELFVVRRELDRDRREFRRSVALGVATGLLLTLGLVVVLEVQRGGSSGEPAAEATPALPVGTSRHVATATALGLDVKGDGAADPGRSPAVIVKEVESHFAELDKAYVAALAAAPALEGAFVLHMTVAPTGAVAYARIEPIGLDAPGLVAAVSARLSTWSFPSIASGMTAVHYPILFHLPASDPATLAERLRRARPAPVEPPEEDEDEDPSDPGTTEPAPAGWTTTQATEVRTQPSWTSSVLRELEAGDALEVVGKQGAWYVVASDRPNGPRGFVWAEHVSDH